MNGIFKIGCAICLVFCSTVLFGQKHTIRQFDPERGLNGTYVYTVIEDTIGYKWVGTDFGLSRFDGINFSVIDNNDSTQINYPVSSVKLPDGHIVFGYQNGMIKCFDGSALRVMYKPDGSLSPVLQILGVREQEVLALTRNHGLVRIRDGVAERLPLRELSDRRANTFWMVGDTLFVGTNFGLSVYQYDSSNGPVYQYDIKGLRGESVLCHLVNGKETFWVGTERNGVYELRESQSGYSTRQLDLLKVNSILSIQKNQEGDLWIATKYHGLVKVNFNRTNTKPIQFTYIDHQTGLPSDKISTLFLDQNQNVWAGTLGNGLVQIVRKGLVYYNFEKFGVKSVNSIAGNTQHEFFFGTDIGVIKASYESDSDSLSFYKPIAPILKNGSITAIQTGMNQKIYIAVENRGLYETNANLDSVKPISFDFPSTQLKIRQIVQDKQGDLWLSIMHHGIFVIDTLSNIKQRLSTQTGFYHNEIYKIYIDSHGNKWFAAHSAGLALMKPSGQIIYLSAEGIFPIRDVNDISEDEDGNIWVGTYGGGVYRYDGEDFVRFAQQDGLLNDYCNSVISDRNNHIWVSHRKGLSRIDERTDAVSTIEQKDGLLVAEFIPGAIYRDVEHDIWMGNRNGVTFLNSPDEVFESQVLPTLVTDIKINHKVVDLYQYTSEKKKLGTVPEQLTFPGNLNNFTFEYIAINMSNPYSNLYQFKLKGYEKEWSPITQSSQTNYTNLEPGEYTFMVRQSDNRNHWSDENISELTFTIRPLWWKTWWFILMVILAVFFTVYWSVHRRIQSIRNRILEKREFIELTENQNRRLKHFSFITSHNIRSSVSNLMGLIEIVKHDPQNPVYTDMLKTTVEKLDKTIQNVSELLNFEMKMDQINQADCNLSETIDRVLTLNQSMVDDHEVEIINTVPRDAVVMAIPAYMDSICNNIITNALKYGVTSTSKKVEIFYEERNEQQILRVKDYGLGIDIQKNKRKLFKLGSRFHSEKRDGNGMGLYMSKRQIEGLGGKIFVKSKVDEGTQVDLIFNKKSTNQVVKKSIT